MTEKISLAAQLNLHELWRTATDWMVKAEKSYGIAHTIARSEAERNLDAYFAVIEELIA